MARLVGLFGVRGLPCPECVARLVGLFGVRGLPCPECEACLVGPPAKQALHSVFSLAFSLGPVRTAHLLAKIMDRLND